jgi:hypothetical protein
MNKIQKYRKESFVCLQIGTIVLLTALLAFWSKIYSESLLMFWTVGVILFLYLYEMMTILVVNKKIQTARPHQIVSLYMLLKVGKIFAFLSVIVIYMLAVRVETKRFVLITVALYFIYLLLDTLFLTTVEKNLKNEKSKENE